MARKLTFIDTESWWCPQLAGDYQRLDPASQKHRIGCRRIGVAAAFDVDIDNQGRVSVGTLTSWTEHAHFDEESVVANLFEHLRLRPGHTVVSYGGVNQDMRVLGLAAMEYGLRLPPQLLNTPGRKGPRPHVDLDLVLKASGKTYHHLSEVALRCGVPVGLLEGKARIVKPVAAGAWETVRSHCELDTLILAIANLSWLASQCENGLRTQQAIFTLVAGFLRQRPDHPAAELLRAYAEGIEARLTAQWDEAA
ncbi:hypothetical protein AAG596_01075 [Citromicrobium bathyomarinum]|uniref:hypothetical protein n=1 Tax=Citromicrobium bathyomarinum TaxID=72174 RepID=UPI003159D7AA